MRPPVEAPDLEAVPLLFREDSSCAGCGGVLGLEAIGDVWFCHDCVAWTRQSNLDPLYDDLGVGD